MLSSSSRPPPPKMAPKRANVAISVMPIATEAATERDEDVAVADVADLVGQHAAQLVPVEHLEDALGDGDGGVLGVAAGGERVGLHLGADVELRHRHAGLLGQLADDRVVLAASPAR